MITITAAVYFYYCKIFCDLVPSVFKNGTVYCEIELRPGKLTRKDRLRIIVSYHCTLFIPQKTKSGRKKENKTKQKDAPAKPKTYFAICKYIFLNVCSKA